VGLSLQVLNRLKSNKVNMHIPVVIDRTASAPSRIVEGFKCDIKCNLNTYMLILNPKSPIDSKISSTAITNQYCVDGLCTLE
jgi:hypothetical protein